MSLEKFIPLSPDKFIRNSKDFEIARFGHLNTVVDYLNNLPTGGSGLITEGEGLNSTIRCGVGNQAFGCYGSALGGQYNTTCNEYTSSLFGRANFAIGCNSSSSGISNIIVARNSNILSGTNNTIACDASQNAWSTESSYSGNYFCAAIPTTASVIYGVINTSIDLTSVWTPGSTFSVTYAYASGNPSIGGCASQIQILNAEVICSEYNGVNQTCIVFCYDPASPSFAGLTPSTYGAYTYSFGYIQKTGAFSDYSTTNSTYHPNTIAGGAFNVINGYTSAATISGGYQNTVSGGYGTIGGGCYNYIYNGGNIAGGRNNRVCNGATITGGSSNQAYYGSFIGSGQSNRSYSTGIIVGGVSNSILTNSNYTFIGTGRSHTIGTCSNYSTISGGYQNCISQSYHSFIGTGLMNCIKPTAGTYNSIITGNSNLICGADTAWAFISGAANQINPNPINSGVHLYTFGAGNIVCATNNKHNYLFGCYNTSIGYDNVYVLGCNITVNRANTTHVNNLSIVDLPTSSAGLPSKSLWYDPTTCVVKFVP